MIKKHNSLDRSEKIVNSFINSMKLTENIDGIVEVFKCKDKQGYMMKLYKTFSPDTDLCVWIYEDLNNKRIHTVIGSHMNCNELNQYVGEELQYKEYPIITNIKKQIVEDLMDGIHQYYDKSISI